MQNNSDDTDRFGDVEQADLDALLTRGLGLVMPEHPDALQRRLMARITRSAAEHAGLLTVRFKQGQWQNLRSGVRYKPLWRGKEGNSVLIELLPGAALPTHRHNWLEEGIVLRGHLQIGGQELTAFDYHVSPARSRHESVRSQQGALAYLRGTSVGHLWSELREFTGGLLPFRGAPCRTVFNNDSEWIELAPGVLEKKLWSDGVTASRYYRMAPGATIEGHRHTMDEECIILMGDLFLGDILLQAGDHQLAPAGSRHGEAYSDNGALLFVRGAAS